MEEPNFRSMGWKMVGMYGVFHLGIWLVTFRSKHALTWQEHVTAVNWALPGLVVSWLLLRWISPVYGKPWILRIFTLPFIGGYLQVLAVGIPLGVFAAVVLTVGEGLHPRSIWTLITVVGVSASVLVGQRSLIDFFAERAKVQQMEERLVREEEG